MITDRPEHEEDSKDHSPYRDEGAEADDAYDRSKYDDEDE